MRLGRSGGPAGELVPLADRLRYMLALRLAFVGVVALFGAAVPDAVGVEFGLLAAVTGVFLVLSVAGSAAWHLWPGRGITLFGGLVILDGFYLAWVAYVTGGQAGTLRHLALVHLIGVTLLASYRTGLKLALWHSILAFGTFHVQSTGFVRTIDLGVENLPGTSYERLAAFIVLFWIVAVATSSFAAINERELRRRKVDLEALARMAGQLESATDTRAVARELRNSLIDAFGFSRVTVVGSRDEGLTVLAADDKDADESEVQGSGLISRAWSDRRTLLVRAVDEKDDPVLSQLLHGARNVLVVPLFAEGHPIGAVVAEHGMRRGSRIERRVVAMVERFGSHAALALRNAALLEEVQMLATIDGLTKVANRRTFEDAMRKEINRAERSGAPISLVMMDIDRFKRLNDDHGHMAGDEVLRTVAATLTEVFREHDIVARFGGEEFAVVMPGCSGPDALNVAQRAGDAIRAADTLVPVTVSGGVATFPEQGFDGDSLVRAADAALYASKRAGRDRMTLSAPGRISRSASTKKAGGRSTRKAGGSRTKRPSAA